jgi:hypothetical protein
MDEPAAESRTFLHSVVWWLGVLALGYGLLHAVTLILAAATQGFLYDRYWMRDREAAFAMSVVQVASTVLLLAGAWGLLRWKPWARVVLVVWSALTISLGLVRVISSTAYFVRETAAIATSQPSYRPNIGMLFWSSFQYWLETCALPILLIVLLRQPEVAKLWARPRGADGFEVIPMASPVVPGVETDSMRD